jgi:hypothetical protein
LNHDSVGIAVYNPPWPIDWNQKHNFRVLVTGSHHQVFLDGVRIISVYEGSGAGGWIGINHAGITADVDNFKISSIPSAVSTIVISGRVTSAATGLPIPDAKAPSRCSRSR